MRFRPIRGRGRYVKIGDSERILTLRYRLADHGGRSVRHAVRDVFYPSKPGELISKVESLRFPRLKENSIDICIM